MRDAPGMSSEDLVKRRVRLMLEQIAAERGWGWQTSLAPELGVAQSYISKLHAGERGPGIDIITAAKDKLGIHHDFFYDEDAGEAPHYREYVGKARPASHIDREVVTYSSYASWLESSPYAKRLQAGEVLGVEADAEVLTGLQRQAFGDGDPGEDVYEALARSAVAKRRGKSVKRQS